MHSNYKKKQKRSAIAKVIRVPVDRSQIPPTDAEWARTDMITLDGVVVNEPNEDLAGRSETWYYVGDDVEFVSGDSDGNAWIGKIYGIKARQDGIVWIEVYWYYSPSDLENEFPGFEFCGKNERIISDKHDYQHYSSLKRVVRVHLWDESFDNPPEVSRDDFYQRFAYHHRSSIEPQPTEFACGICQETYNPFPDSNEPSFDPMHFCARPQCRKWYHRQCLMISNLERNPSEYIGSKGIHSLASDPDVNDLYPIFAPFTFPLQPLGKGKMADPGWAEQQWSSIQERLRKKFNIHPTIIQVAQHPILRCGGDDKYAIAGNVKEVVLARRLIYQALEDHHGPVDEILENLVSEKDWDEWKLDDLYRAIGPDTEAWYNLSHSRILASPYATYWQRRRTEIEFPDYAGIPFVRCPQCNAAV